MAVRNLRWGALIGILAVALIGCVENVEEDGGWFDYEVPASFDAQDEALLESFRPDPDGLGWLLDDIVVESVEFERVGFMFDAEGTPDLDVRISDDGGHSWTEWIPVVIIWSEGELYTAHADLPHGGTNLQVRMRNLEPDRISFLSLEGFMVEFEGEEEIHEEIYEDEIGPSGLGTQTQMLAANNTVDVTRAGWGARSSRCSSRHTINRITVHHTVTPNNDRSGMPARMRQMQNYHMDSRGFCDIGYHFNIGQDGRVYQARAETFMGAHVLNKNSGNGGVSFIGTYSNVVPSSAMMNAGARTIRAIGCHYRISLTRSSVKGHREYGTTACPGAALYGRMANLVSMSNNLTCSATSPGSPSPAPEPTPSPSPSPSPSPGTGTGTVQGIVHVAGNTNQRISGAQVVVGGQRATTNSNGYYSVRVPTGTHAITASASGYQTGSVRRTVSSGSQVWGSVGLSRQQASTSPSGQGRLVGVIYEAPNSARRLSGATVRLSSGASATTGSDGYFAFNVPAGTYTVSVSRSGFQTGSVSRRVGSGATVWGSVGMRRQEARGTLQGVVYESPSTSRRIPGAAVTLSNGQTATSSATGSFSFSVAPGTYRITASKSGYTSATVLRSVGSGAETWGSVGLTKVASATGSLIGVIYVRPDSSERVPGARVWTSTGQSTTANSNGVYTLSGVPSGPVTIYAGATGYTSGAVDRVVRSGEQIWGSVGLGRYQGGSGDDGEGGSGGGGESTQFEGVINLIAPINDELSTEDPEFEWENLTAEIAGSDSFKYRVAVIGETHEETHEVMVAGAVGGTTKTSIGLSLQPGRWVWVVLAIRDSDGHLLAGSVLDDAEAGMQASFIVD